MTVSADRTSALAVTIMTKIAKVAWALGFLISVVILNSIIFLNGCFDRIRGPECQSEIAQWIDLAALIVVGVYIIAVILRRPKSP